MRISSTPNWRSSTVELFVLELSNVTQSYVDWLNDPSINRYLESRFLPHSIDTTRQFVENCLNSSSSLLFGIRSLQLGGAHVGNIKLGPIDRNHGRGDVGVIIGDKAAWGRGIACEAVRLLVNIARDELNLRKLTAGCYGANIGSQKAFLKAGFHIAGERKEHFLIDGAPETLVLMDCLLNAKAGD
jgi:ribosomal-protein-alanine N-acetyltransferase